MYVGMYILFVYLIAYQASLVIKGQNHSFRRTVVVLFSP